MVNTLIAMLAAVTLATGSLPKGSKLLRGSCTTPDGKYTYLVHVIGRHWLPVTQLDRGWCHNAALSVFDAKDGRYLNTVLLDDLDLGAPEPWDVIASERDIVVAHSGSSELSFIDRCAFEKRMEAAQGRDLSSDLSFLKGIRRRVATPKQGPRKLKFQGGEAVVTDYLADKPGVTKGELLFNDARLCFQQWHSCATCHPEGGTDGMAWSFPRRNGFGMMETSCDLRQLEYAKTPRAQNAKRDAEIALFTTLDEQTAREMTDYVRSVMKELVKRERRDER